MKDLLTHAIVKLLESERFYAETILGMDIKQDPSLPAPAGVCIKDRVQLHINPILFVNIPLEGQIAILKHECQHILNDHIPRGKEYAPEVYAKDKAIEDQIINQQKHKLVNVAMDCSINPGIINIEQVGDICLPKKFKLEDGQLFEWYADKLKDNEELKELTHYDGHSLWSESEGDKEMLRAKIRDHINEAAKRTRAAGRLTSDQELLIDKLNQSLVNWKQELRRFVAKQIETLLDTSRKKRNRRYGTLYPGVVKSEELHIGVVMDTSGSMSDEALTQIMSELYKMSAYAKITVVEADSEVKNAYEFDPKKKYAIAGRGGTAYQPALDYFTKNEKIDGLIYFGDMDTADAPEKPKYPVLWAIIGDSNPPGDFGKSIRVKI